MNRFFIRGFGILMAVMLFFTLVSRAADSFLVPQVMVEGPSGKKIEHLVRTEGIVQKSLEIPILIQEGLLVKTVYVQEGSQVGQGDLLAELDLQQLAEQMEKLRDEIKALNLANEAIEDSRELERKKKAQQLRRANEDYARAQQEKDGRLSRLAEEVRQAEEAIDQFTGENEAEKETLWRNYFAKQAAYEEAERELEQAAVLAGRAVEDAGEEAASDYSKEINEISIAQKEKQLKAYEELAENEGKIVAQEAGTVTGVLVKTGQKTPDTAAFTMAYAKGGVSLTAEISGEEARYLGNQTAVSVKKNGVEYEDFFVSSMRQKEDGTLELDIRCGEHAQEFPMGEGAEISLINRSELYPCAVPLSAIHTEQSRNYVFVAEKREAVLGLEYFARSVEVTILEKNSSYAALEEGSLTSESLVIVDSDRFLQAGGKVRLQNP